MKLNIRLIYLYLFSFVGLLVTVIGLTRLVDLGLKVYVFQGADEYAYYEARPISVDSTQPIESSKEQEMREKLEEERQMTETKRQRKREASGALSMIAVGLPLYLYHWKTIQKENKK